mmetsp:Transcript_14534/g.20533  ORF Transcript_14534/g.20533 Transcript_14534/m.20533 type:complete len:341 (-) Transcript_14534:382-1404(-)
MRSDGKAILRRAFSLFEWEDNAEEEQEVLNDAKSDYNLPQFSLDSFYSCSFETVQTSSFETAPSNLSHDDTEITDFEDPIELIYGDYDEDPFLSTDLECESTVLIENAEAIECFLPNISSNRDEIDSSSHGGQEELRDDQIDDNNSDSGSSDEDLSWASPVPVEPPIHDPRFQQVLDEFTMEKESFDRNIDNFSSSPSTVDESLTRVIQTQSRAVTFPRSRGTLQTIARSSNRIQSLPSSYITNIPLLHTHSFRIAFETLPCQNVPIVPLTSYAKKHVVFDTGDDGIVRTELLGPPIRPASEMTDQEKEKLWWQRKDYRNFRESFSCDLVNGFQTGFMCG